MPVLLPPPPMVATFFLLPLPPLPHPRLLNLPIFHPFLSPFQPLSLIMGLPLLPMSTLVHSPLPQNNLLNCRYLHILLAPRTPLRVLTIESMVQGTTDLQLLLPESYLVLAWALRKPCPIQTQFLLRHPIDLQLLCPHLPPSFQLKIKKRKKNRI